MNVTILLRRFDEKQSAKSQILFICYSSNYLRISVTPIMSNFPHFWYGNVQRPPHATNQFYLTSPATPSRTTAVPAASGFSSSRPAMASTTKTEVKIKTATATGQQRPAAAPPWPSGPRWRRTPPEPRGSRQQAGEPSPSGKTAWPASSTCSAWLAEEEEEVVGRQAIVEGWCGPGRRRGRCR